MAEPRSRVWEGAGWEAFNTVDVDADDLVAGGRRLALPREDDSVDPYFVGSLRTERNDRVRGVLDNGDARKGKKRTGR